MNLIYNFLSFVTLLVFGSFVAGLIKPTWFTRLLGKFANRKMIAGVGVASFIVLGGLLGATEPQSVKQDRVSKEAAPKTQSAKLQSRPNQRNK